MFHFKKFPQGRAKNGMRNFDAFIQETELRDINLANGKYTWSNFGRMLQKTSWIDFCSRVVGRNFSHKLGKNGVIEYARTTTQ